MVTPTLYNSSVRKIPKSHDSDRSHWLHFSGYEIALGTADPATHQRPQFLLASATTSWLCPVDLHQSIISKSMLYTFYGRNLVNILTRKTDAGPHWKQYLHLGTVHSYIPTLQIICRPVRSLQTQWDRHLLLCQCTWISLTTMLQLTRVVCKVHQHWLLCTYYSTNKALSRLGSKYWRLSSDSIAMNQFLSLGLPLLFQVQTFAWGQMCSCLAGCQNWILEAKDCINYLFILSYG